MDFEVGDKFLGRLSREVYTVTSVNLLRQTLKLSRRGRPEMGLCMSSLASCIKDGMLDPCPKKDIRVTTQRKSRD